MNETTQKIDWRQIIIEIFENEPDPDVNWTHTTLGEAIGASRGTIERLLKPANNPRHLEEPKYSQGKTLISIHKNIHNPINEPETNDGTHAEA